MVNFTSVFCFWKAHPDPASEKLVPKEEEDANLLTSPKTFIIAVIVSIFYLIFGMITFYLCQMNQTNEEWSWLDAIYFCVVTVSTVGYGDFTPTTTLGKWLAIIYMLLGIALIGVALGIIGGFLMARQEALLLKAMEGRKKRQKKPLLTFTQWRLVGAVIILFLFVGLGALVFYLVEKQNETAISVTDSFFLAAQTVTTVGYGSPTINSNGGKIFAIPYIFLSTLLVAAALGTFADVFIERQQEKMTQRILKAEFDLEAILAMDTDGDASIDLGEFLEYMLVKLNKVSQDDIEKVKAQFRELDVDNSGALDAEDIRIMKEREAKQLHSVNPTSTI